MRKCMLFGGVALILVVFAVSPAAADTCSATKTCSDGSTKSCTGNTSCLLGSDYAECDGTKNYCPSATTTCSASLECQDSLYIVFCSGSGPCSSDPFSQSVTCGSTTKTCAGCQARLYKCLQRLPDPEEPIECGSVTSCTTNSQCGDGFCTSQGSCICP
jgi:hypothetical protein